MRKNIMVISTSLRANSNSDRLADEFMKGAQAAGHTVKKVELRNKRINFCMGCMTCQMKKEGHCIFKDDADEIVNTMAQYDVLVFATPIYFYEMSGQMKTLLDRSNPLFPIDYKFRDIYLLATAADDDKKAMDGAIKGLQGWISCFEQVALRGVIYGSDVDEAGAMKQHEDILKEAYEMGEQI